MIECRDWSMFLYIGYHHNWCKDFVHYTFVIFLFDL
jgi:hypothetical protein